MTRSLLKAPWISLLSLLVLASLAAPQEPDQGEPEKKSIWQTLQDKGKGMVHDAEEAVQQASEKALREAKEKYFPILREAGYEVSEIHLTFSLTPGLTLRANRLVDIEPERRAALLEKYEDDAYAAAVLKAVFLAERVEIEGLEIKELFLTMGLPPQATAVLRPTGGAD